MFSELVGIWKWPWLNLIKCPDICLNGLTETMKTASAGVQPGDGSRSNPSGSCTQAFFLACISIHVNHNDESFKYKFHAYFKSARFERSADSETAEV